MITIQQNENGHFFSRTLNSHMLFQGTNASECFVAKCTWEVRHVTYLREYFYQYKGNKSVPRIKSSAMTRKNNLSSL